MAEHKLNEQWVLEINGVKHMLKAVQSVDIGACTACDFEGQESKCAGFPNSVCGSNSNSFIIKDLGILNEDGCLPSDFGVYPDVYEHTLMGIDGYMVKSYTSDPHVGKYAWGKTKQQAIDAWNRRA